MACVKWNTFSEIWASGHLQFYVCPSGGRKGGWADARGRSSGRVRAGGRAGGRVDGRRAVGGAGGLDILIYDKWL